MDKHSGAKSTDLRRRAEELVASRFSDQPAKSTEDDLRRMVHELRVRLIELEIQNDEHISERKESSAALQEYKELYDHSPVSYVILRDGNRTGDCADPIIMQANQTFEHMIRIDRSLLTDRRFDMLVAPSDRVTFSSFIKKVFASPTPQYCEVALLRELNATDVLRVRMEGAVSHDGQQCRLVLIDVTQRRQAEAAVRESRLRLASITGVNPIGSWEWNIKTGDVTFNQAWAQMLGYTMEELAPLSINTWRRLTHPDDLKHSDELLEHYLGEELPYYDCECRMKHKDGHWVWVRDRGRVITRSYDDQPLLMFGTHVDITVQKNAELALRDSEARLREVLENSLDASYKRNLQTNDYEYLSPVFTRISGYSPDEMRSMSITEASGFIHPDDLPTISRALRASTMGASGATYEMEYRFKHKDGQYRWFLDRYTFMRDAEDKPLAMIGSVGDITERKRLEAELQQQATTDVLTGVHNRRHFLYLARTELKRSLRLRYPLAVALIDIDNLKRVNDTYGHAGGDRILAMFAQVCKANTRDIDVFGRLGGDEFALLIQGTDDWQAFHIVERVRMALAEQQVLIDGHVVTITISAGITDLDLDKEFESIEALLDRADRLLYQAKEAGRNRTCVTASPFCVGEPA